MSNTGSKGHSKAVWLLMLREGGRWRPVELQRALPDEIIHIGGTLVGFSNNGFARRYERKGGSEYGVTLGCKVPLGVTLADLVAAGALHVKPDDTGDQP